jgi:isopentenyl-diphosphate delta-isomerase
MKNVKKTSERINTYAHDDELLDLVNQTDQVVGTLERSKVYAAELRNFRTVSAFLINKQGKLWVPRRTASKRVSPLHLGFSVGGHVSSGETYEQSFARELEEELNMSLSQMHYKKLGLLTPHEHGAGSFCTVYLIFTNETPEYNRQDFVSFAWLSPQQLLEKVIRGKKVQSDVIRALRHFFADRLSHKGVLLDRFAKPALPLSTKTKHKKQIRNKPVIRIPHSHLSIAPIERIA